jgi:hypothetical protein
MRFRARKTFRFGPLRFNFTQSGFSSWGVQIGRWSWNAKTRRHYIDTPGPGGFQSSGRRRRNR